MQNEFIKLHVQTRRESKALKHCYHYARLLKILFIFKMQSFKLSACRIFESMNISNKFQYFINLFTKLVFINGGIAMFFWKNLIQIFKQKLKGAKILVSFKTHKSLTYTKIFRLIFNQDKYLQNS